MKIMLVVVLVASLLSLAYSIWNYLHHRRLGKSVPYFEAGNITSGVGMLAILGASALNRDDLLTKSLVIAGLVFTIWSIVLFGRAYLWKIDQ